MNQSYILEIKGLRKEYSKFTLNNINVELEKGSIMGFIGPNGAGKSTTIKSILNIISYDSGEIIINGINSKDNEVSTKEIIGYVGDETSLYSQNYAKSVYKFIRRFYKNWDDEVFNSLIRKFNLNLDKKVKEFSKGMKAQFMLALSLSHHAKLFILDEPTSGLDPVIRAEILDIIFNTVKEEGASVFFSSHITEDIQKIADSVTYINNGNILLSDKKVNILSNYKQVDFNQDISCEFEKKLTFYRNKKLIIHKSKIEEVINLAKSYNIDSRKIEFTTPLLDEILLNLIKKQN
ncbi:ABC transporter ATP-binding protein [Tepiditoga spiralis]|uniref:ABC transporter ATP-binding protein n=1 Tax=Tepiditoga spiralis TaxID=2108365 RepID=A0A7G1GBK6_9BACT|nr:ABC transporter ATP-binding protein [Tepiditoga spiralis]BBE31792.1 ABC transporter ATP-binding protein [Tepiditoga spiralis]